MDFDGVLLLEAESFDSPGGWRIDQQFMDSMGSPFLLAHGLGEPVENARTKARFKKTGKYRVWVRTRDWAAPSGPGKFRLIVNSTPLGKAFGSGCGPSWAWSDGGAIEMKSCETIVELEDLTGFEGRCDAILFVPAELGFIPPDGGPELDALRRKLLALPDDPPSAGFFDFAVAGGGYAGICAAIAAARAGLKTALLHDRPVLGGNASGEVRVGPIGGLDLPPFPSNGDIAKELLAASKGAGSSGGIRPEPDDYAVQKLVESEKLLSLFLNAHAIAVEKDGAKIASIVAKDIRSSKELRFSAKLFADCTGDASIGHLAGASWMLGREGRDKTGEPLAPERADSQLLGVSNFWLAKETDSPQSFPECPWAPRLDEESIEVSAPKYPPKFDGWAYAAGWNWEGGFNADQLAGAEEVRDRNLLALYGAWDFLKNRSRKKAKYANAKLDWAAFVMGKRETRRLAGDLVLTQNDMTGPARRTFPDACVTATWYFDLHFPHPENSRHFPGKEFRSLAYDDPNFEKLRGSIPGSFTELEPYPIPFRCLYSKDVPNLFMAGRNISVTHAALAPVRVMNTTAMMGTVAGRAAALCLKLDASPRQLCERHLDALKAALSKPELMEGERQ